MTEQHNDDLKTLHNMYGGERVFVIGNGPSLSNTPLELLAQEHTFTLNNINLIYPELEWRPNFYLFMKNSINNNERSFIEENIDQGTICFINEKYMDVFGRYNNVHYIERKKLPSDPLTVATKDNTQFNEIKFEQLTDVWSDDITQGVYKQHSMYPILQIVGYLGFDNVYLLGCDLGFEVQKPYLLFESGLDPANYNDKLEFLSSSANEYKPIRSIINGISFKLLQTRFVDILLKKTTDMHDDRSHFTESYEGKIRFKDVNEEIMNAHRVAKRILNENGVDVYNATIGGELEVYPRIELNEVIK